MNAVRTAFLGLGRMGAPMAARIANTGAPLSVWNRSSDKAHAFAKQHGDAVDVVATPRQAAQDADQVISMMANDEAALDVHLGPNGTVYADPAPSLVIECGTVSPDTVGAIAREAQRRGIAFVDAPVSGSIDAARSGNLLFLVGGSEAAVERSRALLDRMGRRIVHVGDTGRGALAKLLINHVLHALNQATSEALALARAEGLDVPAFYDALADSAAGAPMLGYRRSQYVGDDADVAFALRLAAKDVRLVLDAAIAAGTPTSQMRCNLEQLEAAIEAGHGDDDMAALATFLAGSTARTEGEP